MNRRRFCSTIRSALVAATLTVSLNACSNAELSRTLTVIDALVTHAGPGCSTHHPGPCFAGWRDALTEEDDQAE